MMITASERLVRIPAAICGNAPGRTSRLIRSCLRHAVRAGGLDAASGRSPRTPSIVFSRIGKTQKKAMNETFWTFPIECSSTIEIGSRAGGGIARHHSMWGIAHTRAQRDSPSGIPIATPTTTAIPKPSAIRSRLGTTWVPNSAKSHISRNSTRIVESRGNCGFSARTVQSCHAARIASGTAISARDHAGPVGRPTSRPGRSAGRDASAAPATRARERRSESRSRGSRSRARSA